MNVDIDTAIQIYPDKEAISRQVARHTIELIHATLKIRPYFSIALAGGSTPRMLYSMFATDYKEEIPWDKLLIFWGDERYVRHSDEKSNFRMAREAMLDLVPIPAEQIFPISTEPTNPNDAAASYAVTIKKNLVACEGRFDLILLGMGDDGHTASLFPGSPALEESELLVVAAPAPVEPKQRITLTYRVINNSRNVFFLVAGENKAQGLLCATGGPSEITDCPSGKVNVSDGNLTWYVDEAAARLL